MALQQRFKNPAEKRGFAPKDAASYIGLSVDNIYETIYARAIPYAILPSKGTRRPRYLIDRRDLDGWLERRKISAIERRAAMSKDARGRTRGRKW